MLKQIRLQNFRCFNDHTITLRNNTVIVGKNNAGKSSVIEALRIIAAVVNRRSSNFEVLPSWLDLPRFRKGITVGISQLGLDLRAVFHRYGRPPAIIKATFEGGAQVDIFVGPDEKVFATFERRNDSIVSSGGFSSLNLTPISVLPQIGPLKRLENNLTDERVRNYLNSHLSSRHFRNQILRMDTEFRAFKVLAEETWSGLRIDPLRSELVDNGTQLLLDIRDGDFVGEVALMGHGLQMWLQTIWFLSRTPANHIVVLDEPDVYMHPDLQRKLFRLTSSRFSQTVIASHSVEIMSEADPSDILVIDKKAKKSGFANDEPGVQLLVDNIGGIHNVHLARLWSAKKFLLLEGKDLSFLRLLHSKACPEAEVSLDAIPTLPIGGWSGWHYAVGSSMTMKNAAGDQITCYCLLDSDYHTEGEILARYTEAKRRGLCLHIWKRKEIENYLIHPKAIKRVIANRFKGENTPSEDSIKQKILEICESLRRSVEDSIASAIVHDNRGIELATANKMARVRVEAAWQSEQTRQDIISGKEILSQISAWSQDEFGVALGPPAIARAMTRNDIPQEMLEVINALEDGTNFPE
jgi:hypothetical protein